MKKQTSSHRLILGLTLASTLALLAGCSKSAAEQGGQQRAIRFPVDTVRVEVAEVQFQVEAVGSVDAFEQVEITARVAGVVDHVRFGEGDRAAPGAVLVEIDAARYRLAVESAEATLAAANAALAEARAGLERREAASERNPGLIRGEELDTWRARLSTAGAQVRQAEASLAQAKLNFSDALVKAPVSGVIQTRTVQTGQYVQVGSVLATMVRRDPLLLRFQVPEQDARSITPGMSVTFNVADKNAAYQATISHVAASANPLSRMVDITAQVTGENRDELRPGTFAQVRIPIGTRKAAPVIPQTAIRPSERGFLAYVVVDGKAVERLLNLGMRTEGGQVEVVSGLEPGDELIIRGNEALRDGADVVIGNQ
jgi:membrane fusion protein, multidrug efflux system